MSDPHATDQRLTELEIKASYTEDLLDQMNLALYDNSSRSTGWCRS